VLQRISQQALQTSAASKVLCIENNGRVYWSTDDAGEGERVNIHIQTWEVKPPGSEPELEFLDAEVDEEKYKSVNNDSEETEASDY
jgi:hypothetical protein